MSQGIKLFITTLIFLFITSQAFAQQFEWAKKAGGSGLDEGSNLYVDVLGNSYVVGGFSMIATFESVTLTTTPRINIHRSDDVFLAKYDTNGNLIWVIKMSSSNLDYGKDIAVDASGNIYVTGGFSGSAIFENTSLTSSGFMDVFIVKYNNNGHLLWAKKAGGNRDDLGHSIGLDNSGNCYLTGFFHGTASFNGITLDYSEGSAFFIAKYDVDGNVIWAKSASGSNTVVGFEIAVDPKGNCYATGFFYGNATFASYQLPGSDQRGIFIVKYDTNGTTLWAKELNNKPWESYSFTIALDNSGGFYLTGVFTGNIRLGTFYLTSAGNFDAFIVKYDANGNVTWAKKEGGTGREDYLAIATNKEGELFLVGNFQGTSILGKSALTSSGESDLFIIKYNASGEVVYSLKAGGTAKDIAYHVALDAFGNAYIVGYFAGKALFDDFTLESKGDTDIFIAKLGNKWAGLPTVTTNPLHVSTYCAGSTVAVYFNAQGNFNGNNSFIAQLSDSIGSFISPTIIGSGNFSPLQVTIPVNLSTGKDYKIRIVASSPMVISSNNIEEITINSINLPKEIPNIITPNSDGLNETFNIAEPCITLKLAIYNRWGKMVYEKEDYRNSWNGGNLNDGTYYYKIISEQGQMWKGWVEIIR